MLLTVICCFLLLEGGCFVFVEVLLSTWFPGPVCLLGLFSNTMRPFLWPDVYHYDHIIPLLSVFLLLWPLTFTFPCWIDILSVTPPNATEGLRGGSILHPSERRLKARNFHLIRVCSPGWLGTFPVKKSYKKFRTRNARKLLDLREDTLDLEKNKPLPICHLAGEEEQFAASEPYVAKRNWKWIRFCSNTQHRNGLTTQNTRELIRSFTTQMKIRLQHQRQARYKRKTIRYLLFFIY